MAGLSAQRVRILRLLGRMPSVQRIEARRNALRREFERYQKFAASPEYARYQELQRYQESGVPEQERIRCQEEVYEGSQEGNELDEYNALEKTKEVKLALRGQGEQNSAAFRRFQELQKHVETPAFAERIAYLRDKNKFRRTEAYAKLQELKVLSKSRELQWYLSHEAKGTFAELVRERVLFFDDFTASALDKKVWLPRFFWGEALVGRGYSFIGDPHCYTEGDNLTLGNSALVIETRPEARKALAWDKELGFLPADFSYTSGLICSGQSFRMQEGRLEVKLRIKSVPGVYHALYLAGETRAPQIDIFRTTSGKKVALMSGVTRNEVNSLNAADGVGALPSGEDYFLLRFDWEGTTLRWSINDTPYMTMENVKGLDMPMYLVFASGVEPGAAPTGVAQMAIDWVRCTSYNK